MSVRKLFLLLLALCGCFALAGCGEDNPANVPTTTMGEVSEYRPTFTTDTPPNYQVLNSITDDPIIGDEREFVRIYDDEGTEYIDEITLEPNRIYEVRIYYHNNCANSNNTLDNTRCSATLPESISSNPALLHGKLTCNAEFPAPKGYEDTIQLRANQDVSLFYISESDINHYYRSDNVMILTDLKSNQLFSSSGAKIGSLNCCYPSGYVSPADQPSYVSFSFFVAAGIAADSETSTNTP